VHQVIEASPAWEQVAPAGWRERIMQMSVTDRHHAKQGRSVARWRLERDGQVLTVYLKRHERLPAWHGWLASAWPEAAWSPGLQEWHNLAWARRHGVPVPATPAVGQFVGPGARLQSFLAVEELSGMLALHEAVPLAAERLAPQAFTAWKASLTQEMARVVRLLHDRNRFHQDLYLCHFFVRVADIDTPPTDWQGRVVLIDFHRLTHAWAFAAWWQVKDLAQLLYSSQVVGVTARDRLRFWRAYGGTGWLAAAVRLKAARYDRHNRKRRAAA
jgi:heptose I phosphotransferase